MTSNKIVGHGLAGLTGKLAILFLSALLAACGGGGGSGGSDDGGSSSSSSGDSGSGGDSSGGDSSGGDGETAPDQPTVTMEPQATKTFQFSWEPVSGANEYRLLENPDGISGYQQVASADGETSEYGLVVFLPERVNASYILQACNSAGCTDSDPVTVEVTALTGAIGYLKASEPDADDYFGSVALSADGDTLAIGAEGDDGVDDGRTTAGAVYIFTRDHGTWQLQDYLRAPYPANDRFGKSIALSADGNVLAIGAHLRNSSSFDDSGTWSGWSGAAYVFTRSGSSWAYSAYLKASNFGGQDYFGNTVALSADGLTLAVSAPEEDGSITSTGSGDGDNNDASNLGAVYVFAYRDNTWQQQAYLKPSIYNGEDRGFGNSLSISADGSILAVGMPFEDGADANPDDDIVPNDTGAVYVFTRSGDTWQQDGYLKASVADNFDYFGTTVALSGDGNTLAIGADGEDSGIPGDATDSSAENSGAVYMFRKESGIWSQTDFLKASNMEEDDTLGYGDLSLSADGTLLAVGALLESSASVGINADQQDNGAEYSGAVYLFRYTDGEWRQQSYLKAPNTDGGDGFGERLALSADGEVLAVGTYYESSSGAQDDNSVDNAGAVYLY